MDIKEMRQLSTLSVFTMFEGNTIKEVISRLKNYASIYGEDSIFETKGYMSGFINVRDPKTAALTKETIDFELIDDVVIAGIDTNDHPDYCDAYIESAYYDYRNLDMYELEMLNETCSDYVYERVMEEIN